MSRSKEYEEGFREGRDEGYDAGYDSGYDEGQEAGDESSWQRGYDDAVYELQIGEDSKDRNMCLKCDCRKYSFDCIQDDPVGYMRRKLEVEENLDQPKPVKRTKNPDYDRAMEIFAPRGMK